MPFPPRETWKPKRFQAVRMGSTWGVLDTHDSRLYAVAGSPYSPFLCAYDRARAQAGFANRHGYTSLECWAVRDDGTRIPE